MFFGWEGDCSLAEVITAYCWEMTSKVTCGLTACTPGSAPGPTFGNKYGKALPVTFSVPI